MSVGACFEQISPR